MDSGHIIVGLYLKGDNELQGICSYHDEPDNQAIHGDWIVSNPKNRKSNPGGKRYEGVGGHFFAIMGDVSMKKGYKGFMYGKAKDSALLKYYCEKLGATPFPSIEPYSMCIDEKAMQKLLAMYNFDWGE